MAKSSKSSRASKQEAYKQDEFEDTRTTEHYHHVTIITVLCRVIKESLLALGVEHDVTRKVKKWDRRLEKIATLVEGNIQKTIQKGKFVTITTKTQLFPKKTSQKNV